MTVKITLVFRDLRFKIQEDNNLSAYQMEPPSPIQALGLNPFPSTFINRTFPWGGFARWLREEPMKIENWQQAASAFMWFNRTTKKIVLFINLLRKGLTQEINRDGGSIWWVPDLRDWFPLNLSETFTKAEMFPSLQIPTNTQRWVNLKPQIMLEKHRRVRCCLARLTIEYYEEVGTQCVHIYLMALHG